MTAAGASPLLSRSAGIKVFVCLAGAYLLSYALRSINAAIAPELVAEFSLSNTDLGYLSSAYFLGFALMQLPLGVWLDRFGTRRTNACLMLVAALGCALFAMSSSTTALWLARVLIGAGFSCALMGSLRAFRFWFAADRQQQLIAWMLVVGSTGALLASSPSRALLPLVGWRGLFIGAAVLLVVAAAAIFVLLPRTESYNQKPAGGGGFAGYLTVYKDRFFWRFAVVSVILQSGFIAFQTLWIGPWFTEVLGVSAGFAGQVIFAFNLVLLSSFFGLGVMARRMHQRGSSLPRLCQGVIVLIIATHLVLSYTDSLWLAVALWIFYGLVATPLTLLQSHVGMAFPSDLTGRAYTGYNLLVFSGMFLVQWLFGALVDWCLTVRDTEPEAFRLAMQIWAAIEFLALLWLTFFRARPYSEVHGEANEAPGKDAGDDIRTGAASTSTNKVAS